ncbi:MAG: PQQ-dependent sugar dehydrogenase [Myxococcota bacterium]|nr:PQQ-dependent sugar dehydrogenase [Myxococcota bacterium]
MKTRRSLALTAATLGIGVGAVVAGCGGDKKPTNPPDDAAVVMPDAAELPRCATPVAGTKVALRSIGRVVGAALLATSPPADPRLFVLEQRGAIRIFKNEALQPDPFLDLSADASGPVLAGGENGLLGLAFHPQYASNGQFFVFYTARLAGDPGNPQRDVLARCQVSAGNPDRADAASCVDVLSIPDFATNHNGGMIEFGADGLLYIGTGDGGGGGDPARVGQNLTSLLGKMLRIDVDARTAGKEYGIPAANPYAAGGGAPEILMRGLRNPWRWSFDRETGDMWIADVGQDEVEELTVIRAGQFAGKNLGWSMYEGTRCFRAPCDPAGQTFPQAEHARGATGWASITGGQVYRGSCYPDLVGWHFYTDYVRGGLVKARLAANDTLEVVPVPGTFPGNIASIHADARGELYATNTEGNVYHLEATP